MKVTLNFQISKMMLGLTKHKIVGFIFLIGGFENKEIKKFFQIQASIKAGKFE